MSHVYILKLGGGFWYVGFTKGIADRIRRHSCNSGATNWTKLHKVVDVVYVAPHSRADEDLITRDMMILYGCDKVRGGNVSQPEFSPKADWSWVPHHKLTIIKSIF